ncbi:MAG: adenylate/guanylate cyclase domain-containing protein [Mariprofundaceae bacterium]|nr:adenylate/guanylate cyclase domain-containing protein [Mariprofundaceae bacterium]
MSTRSKLFLSHFFTILIIVGVIGGFFYQSAKTDLMDGLKSRLLNSSALIVRSFDAEELSQIRYPQSEESDVFKKNRQIIQDLSKTNSDISFIYVMRKTNNKIYFVIDSDEENPAFPGQEYSEMLPEMLEGFEKPSVDAETNTDEWGTFLSGYAPIKGGKDPMLIGIDMHAEQVNQKFQKLQKSALISSIIAIIIAFILSHFLSRHFTRRMDRLLSLFSAITQKPLYELIERNDGDELDRLSLAFDILAQHINAEQGKNAELKQDLESKLADEIQQRLQLEEKLQQDQTHIKRNILNQRAIMQIIKNEANQHDTDEKPFNLALLRFKYIDGFDDELTIQISTYLNTHMQAQEVFARWDSKTLILLLPDHDEQHATTRLKGIQSYLEDSDFFVDEKYIKLPFHVGLNTLQDPRNLDDTIRCLNTALNEAKDSCEHSVVFWAGVALNETGSQ